MSEEGIFLIEDIIAERRNGGEVKAGVLGIR